MSPSQDQINEFIGVAHGDLARLKELLAADPALLYARATWGESALEAAAQMGNVEIIEFLLGLGVPVDICTAAVLGRRETVEQFLNADPRLIAAEGAHGLPLLYFAAIAGHQAMAQLLLERGANPNAGEGQTTALHGAVSFRQREMVAWLLAHGARPDAKNFEGKTPLALAQEAGDEALTALLTH